MKKFFRQLSTSPFFELCFRLYIKNYKKITIITTAFLLGIILLLGWMSARSLRKVVVEDFNQQQLLMARHAASQIEDSLNHLKREMSLLGMSPSLQYSELIWMEARMKITFSSVKEKGVLDVRFINERNARTYVVNGQGYRSVAMSPEDEKYLDWARREDNQGKILLSDIRSRHSGSNNKKLILEIVTPVWQVSVDETHPVAQNKFSGALMFPVDATILTGKVLKAIQSGRTGYAWVIDRNGNFLYHFVRDFIGENAFEVRKRKAPEISFDKINEIQQEAMLKGKDGASWYISGWHRDRKGEIKKLIAYAPVRPSNEAENHIWSVAVVAPISEVEGAIWNIQIRQFLLQGVGILAIISGGLFIVGLMLRWSVSLKSEVENTTKELRKSESLYRSLIENAEDIIFTVDRQGRLLSMNEYGYYFLNKNQEDIIGLNITEVFQDEEAGSLVKTIERVFETNISKNLINRVRVNGSEYLLNTNLSGLLDGNGHVISVLGISRDITESKKIEEHMYHTEKLASLGTMSAGVAHEINNPLAIILGFTEMLIEKMPPDSESHEILKTMERQGLKAKRIVENLLSFARFGEPKVQDVNINEDIEAILAVEGNTLLLNNITVEKNMEESLPFVKGDPCEIQQIFFNIINNAISAMKEGGVLKIATRSAEDGGRNVEISISDTGIGIKREYRAKIFDPFFTTKSDGTGLGLTITYALAIKYGGLIAFETKTKEESEETGTTFIVTLPAVKAGNSQ
ncbi:MAG: ATP-binding protein [Thermodesulfovibrionales bacterium]|nr:ATP-binding protein [Thermodesulfovibrionales bacterium]